MKDTISIPCIWVNYNDLTPIERWRGGRANYPHMPWKNNQDGESFQFTQMCIDIYNIIYTLFYYTIIYIYML